MFHTHLLVKGFIEKPPAIEKELELWMEQLVKDINMKIMSGPHVKYLNVAGNRGITGVVVIETSHCSFHAWDEQNPALVQLDVYSCADFKTISVLKRLDDFNLLKFEAMRIDRNGAMKVLDLL